MYYIPEGSPCHKPSSSHLLLRYRVATNISHWLKGGICKKVYFDQLLDFPILLLLFLHTLLLCHMLDFFHTIRVSNSLDILSGLIWVQTVCIGY